MEYTRLSLAEAAGALNDIAREAQAVFGGLDERRLNWKPDPARWSVGQCFQHLLTSNELTLAQATDALSHPPSSIWQRLPVLPRLLGSVLVRSQAPGGSRRYVAAPVAQPAPSDIPGDVIARFGRQQVETARWMETLDARDAAKTIMISPFVKVVTYSVLDACRLIAAHDRRHFEQARRVTESVGFPSRR